MHEQHYILKALPMKPPQVMAATNQLNKLFTKHKGRGDQMVTPALIMILGYTPTMLL